MSDCRNPHLSAYDRAAQEDMERSRAVSGDAATAVDADTGGTEKTPQEPRECGRITFTDTREMLEEDVREWCESSGALFPRARANTVIEWLDRQAAITERECREYEDALREQHHKRIAELQADRDELQRQLGTMRGVTREFRDERDEWKAKAKTQRNNFYQATEAIKQWQRKYENLRATSYSAEVPSDKSELARELGKALAERDMYRDKLGRAIDAAHEVVRMMEVE